MINLLKMKVNLLERSLHNCVLEFFCGGVSHKINHLKIPNYPKNQLCKGLVYVGVGYAEIVPSKKGFLEKFYKWLAVGIISFPSIVFGIAPRNVKLFRVSRALS